MRLAIIGSRGFTDLELAIEEYDKLFFEISQIVSGGARGADNIAEQIAKIKNIPITIFKANWEKYSKRAGYLRNIDIIDNSDIIMAFWDGDSKGTKHSLELAQKSDKPVILINYIL